MGQQLLTVVSSAGHLDVNLPRVSILREDAVGDDALAAVGGSVIDTAGCASVSAGVDV